MIIFENTDYKIQSFISGMLSNNSYLITSKTSKKNIIIDIPYIPRDLFSKIPRDPLNKSNNVKNTIGIITHGHFDHIEGIDFIKDRYGEIEIYMGFEDSKYLDYSGKITKLRSQEKIIHEDIQLEIVYTPGHSQGSICLYFDVKEKKYLFSGDTLLINGTGRTDFQNGSSKDAYNSLFNKLLKLPDDTVLYPGHDYNGKLSSTIGKEKQHNPRLQVRNVDEYVELMSNLNLAKPKLIDINVSRNIKLGAN